MRAVTWSALEFCFQRETGGFLPRKVAPSGTEYHRGSPQKSPQSIRAHDNRRRLARGNSLAPEDIGARLAELQAKRRKMLVEMTSLCGAFPFGSDVPGRAGGFDLLLTVTFERIESARCRCSTRSTPGWGRKPTHRPRESPISS